MSRLLLVSKVVGALYVLCLAAALAGLADPGSPNDFSAPPLLSQAISLTFLATMVWSWVIATVVIARRWKHRPFICGALLTVSVLMGWALGAFYLLIVPMKEG